MRTLLAVLAWCVMVGAVLGSGFAVLGALSVMHERGIAISASAGPMFYLAVNTGFRLVEAFALGLGLLFLLNVDKRLRTGHAAGLETR